MEMNRVESFSDGVIAVIITIMVLELKVPADPSLDGLLKVMPQFLAYLLSFVTVAIMWANHHHLLKGARTPDSRLLWANNNLLFWMSLIPFATTYMAAHPLQPNPVALYGIVCTMMGLGFAQLRYFILTQHHTHMKEAPQFQRKMHWKNIMSAVGYVVATLCAFSNPWISYVIYAAIPISYFLPDKSLVDLASKTPS